ncbi:MAG: hypothetical protein Q8R02_05215 [Hyphomonadaceae bacterium]|nr:hypothetical protein [Hyphomonadaceae bacterium]
MRGLVVSLSALGLAAACDAPESADNFTEEPTRGAPVTDPNTFRADVDLERPYAGEWAAATNQCSDQKKVWTIEARRMAILPAMRFCAFDNIYVSEGNNGARTIWSASAKCLADGSESHDFLFFRVKDNLKEMKVTFNDTSSVELVRCPVVNRS